jgi:hypothetical protein
MRIADCGVRNWAAILTGLSLVVFASLCSADETSVTFTTETLRGHVVYLAEAMEKRTGVSSVPEARERILALKTTAGDLVPLLEDVRARAFRRDDRLRQMQVELVVRHYERFPAVQIIRVFEVAADGRYEIDYWCDICAIAMFEKKDCECCQGDVELRRRKVDGF